MSSLEVCLYDLGGETKAVSPTVRLVTGRPSPHEPAKPVGSYLEVLNKFLLRKNVARDSRCPGAVKHPGKLL